MSFSRVAVIAALISIPALASTCARYQNQLSPCDFAANCSNPTRQETMTYRQWLNSDTPLDACKKYYRKIWPNYSGPIAYAQVSRVQWACYVDVNEDGMLSRYESTVAHSTVTYNTQVERDWCCDADVWGPYWDNAVTQPPAGEGYFSSTQKQAFKSANELNGKLWSDAAAFGTSGGLNVDHWEDLYYHSDIYAQNDDGGPYLMILADQAAEVDHIIPRKDSNGCSCGTNQNRNAAIISRRLNRELSNDCENPSRIAIIQYYMQH